ncbi:MAG: hypothetical protein MK078_07580 [Crocinitomicaceae bacterium]|nr:hypothetical protein [Crocinitomicaceae bacterium]
MYRKIFVPTLIALSTLLFTQCGSENREADDVEIVNTDFTYEFNETRDLKQRIRPWKENYNETFDTTINAENGGTIVMESGSFVDIPKDAFLDESGTKVEGDVDIQIDEFIDPFDFLDSGIPMITSINEEEISPFQSAGMIDFKAFQNGIELKPNPENLIQIGIASKSIGDYPLYSFDEGSGWNQEADTTKKLSVASIDSIIEKKSPPKPISVEVAVNHFYLTDNLISANPKLKKYKDFIFAPKEGSYIPSGSSNLTVNKMGANEY